jgi:hypothetical protein
MKDNWYRTADPWTRLPGQGSQDRGAWIEKIGQADQNMTTRTGQLVQVNHNNTIYWGWGDIQKGSFRE